jgi:hypothetical protein
VLLFATWEQQRRLPALILSLPLFVLAFLTKQPLAAAALVPLVAVVCRPGKISRRRIAGIAVAALPFLATMVALLGLWETNPIGFFYMVTLPSQYSVRPFNVARTGFELLLMYSPLLFVVIDLAVHRAWRDARIHWWASGTIVFLVTGVVTTAKDGGWRNSLLPFMIASAGLLTLYLPRLIAHLDDTTLSIGRRVVVSGHLALILIAFAVRRPGEALAGLVNVQGDARYQDVVALARELRGPLRCPEDPTIPLLARGEITRSVHLEADATFWPKLLPAYVDADLEGARYAIQVNGPYQRLLTDEWLTRLGFAPVREDTLEGSVYRLWEKKTAE